MFDVQRSFFLKALPMKTPVVMERDDDGSDVL
jgi:hypothetical protein